MILTDEQIDQRCDDTTECITDVINGIYTATQLAMLLQSLATHRKLEPEQFQPLIDRLGMAEERAVYGRGVVRSITLLDSRRPAPPEGSAAFADHQL